MTIWFFFNDTATTEIYTLSLHDALPISPREVRPSHRSLDGTRVGRRGQKTPDRLGHLPTNRGAFFKERPSCSLDRKSTRLNSSHQYLVCRLLLEKKNLPVAVVSTTPITS